MRHILPGLAMAACAANASAAGIQDCLGLQDDPVRLACYDKLAKEALPAKTVIITDDAPGTPPALPMVIENPPPPSPVSALSERWELDPQSKAGTFQFRSHNATYFLPFYGTSDINSAPSTPSRGAATVARQQPGEIKFQISFKTKLLENMLGGDSDLWFGYTQQSHWQFYNGDTSRPFRETDYQPEIIWTVPTDYSLLGWRGRLVNLGVVHQSNGQTDPLSRSWNRVYAQAGFEKGDWVLMVRPWWRLPDGKDDDNPDIRRYMGQGDLVAMWKRDGHVVTLMGRRSLSSGGKGALQADWAFPIRRQLKGHLQLFSGYGENLIDYNHRQTTVGFGVSLSEGL
jgi:phospholipase A1/A2